MTGCYFWKDGEVHFRPGYATDETRKEFVDIPCVDTNEGVDDFQMRYGRFTKRNHSWSPIDLEYFPKEFRTHLLLLGVV